MYLYMNILLCPPVVLMSANSEEVMAFDEVFSWILDKRNVFFPLYGPVASTVNLLSEVRY